jgi:hypothetical protein
MIRRGLAITLALLCAAILAGCAGTPSAPPGAGTASAPPGSGALPCGSSNMALAAVMPIVLGPIACASPAPIAPGGGLSLDEAVGAALQLAPPSSVAPTVNWTLVGQYGNYGHALVPAETWVWSIGLAGDFKAAVCPTSPAPPRPCGPAAQTQRIVIDYYTGAFIESSVD